jgi:hypothetical protein
MTHVVQDALAHPTTPRTSPNHLLQLVVALNGYSNQHYRISSEAGVYTSTLLICQH